MGYNRLEIGSFKVKVEEGKFKPGDPLQQDRFSMGMSLGTNLMVLYTSHDNVTHFQVVDTKTGDTINVEVVDWQSTFKEMWEQLGTVTKADVVEALEDGRKIWALKLIRQDTLCDLRTAKMMIDSQWIWDQIHILRHFEKKEKARAVDNGDGTGSLKGKLVGMGF